MFKELDNETGLYYYGMRYYAPWIARFISVDPLQFKYPYYTPFQYAGNKPISYIDLDGAEEFRTTTGELIYRHVNEKGDFNFVSYIVEDKFKELVDFTTKRMEINKAYLDESGQIQFSFKTTEEVHYFQYDANEEGYLEKDSKEYQNLMKYSRSNELGNKVIELYERDKTLHSDAKWFCTHCTYLRYEQAYSELYGEGFPSLGSDFGRVWNVNKTNLAESIDIKYRNIGAPGAIVGSGWGDIYIDEEIWEGKVEPGAAGSWRDKSYGGGHGIIFLGYTYEDDNISGIVVWDYLSEPRIFDKQWIQEHKQVRFANPNTPKK